MEKVLSIIIPTYNMEKYLNKCLDSLIVPNMDLLEVLIINDGSKDRSSEIAHEYENKYPGVFRVIDKENGNYGSCVNRGLKEATGKYVKILDADDSFDTENFQVYLDKIKEIDVDLIVTDFAYIDEYGTILDTSNFSLPVDICENYNFMFKNGDIVFYINMHAITYRLENLKQMSYSQTEGISYTDVEWCFAPMTSINTGIYYKLCLYKYLIGRPGQTMDNSVIIKQVSQLIQIITKIVLLYNQYRNSAYAKYLGNIIYSQSLNIYNLILLNKNTSYSLLISFDELLKTKCTDIYRELGVYRRCRIRYIDIWRKCHSKMLQGIFNLAFDIHSYFQGHK